MGKNGQANLTSDLTIKVTKLPHGQNLDLPNYASQGAAAMDLLAACEGDITLKPLERLAVPCGFAMALPAGFEAQVRARSGLALKQGLMVLNGPGTIDEDYRGEVKVILANISKDDIVIERGMRIAQMVIAPVTRLGWQQVDSLDETQRGAGGFGSTGVKS